jgi:hypothetical protein
MTDLQTRLEGTTLVVRIPMRFQHRGGRKRIVAPDGSAIVPTSKPQPDGTLVKALARAWRWQRMLDCGKYPTRAELADAEELGGVSPPPTAMTRHNETSKAARLSFPHSPWPSVEVHEAGVHTDAPEPQQQAEPCHAGRRHAGNLDVHCATAEME